MSNVTIFRRRLLVAVLITHTIIYHILIPNFKNELIKPNREEIELNRRRLINLRKQGIKSLAEARLYLKLQQIREENQKSLKIFRSNHQFNLKNNKETAALFNAKSKPRRVSAPIDIIGMPGYMKLNEKEKSLCKNIRLVPATYLHLKDILHAEQTKNGYVKLQVARKLLKIDVNKTRRLYDFLVEEGVINKQ